MSTTNPAGDLTSSDFKLAALVAGTNILIDNATTPYAAVYCGSDNVLAVSWCGRGSVSSTGPNVLLLRWPSTLT